MLQIHPTHPQPRLIAQVVAALRDGAVIAYPTDSCYALGCMVGDKPAQDRIRVLRGLDERHHFTLVCRDLSELGVYARVDNQAYRLIRRLTPGPYTFLLRATREVPRRLQNERRKTIGLRIPEHAVAQALLAALGEPLMSSTAMLPGADLPLGDAESIEASLRHQLDVIVDGGPCGTEPTTVLDLSGESPLVVRAGKGPIDELLAGARA
jgi:tRNA threonylcarbamoyl adenosine modification protein (Sua5/YciO/YrdC/YwlC family)